MRIKNFSILIFVLLICCIGAVSATEDNTIDNNLNTIFDFVRCFDWICWM